MADRMKLWEDEVLIQRTAASLRRVLTQGGKGHTYLDRLKQELARRETTGQASVAGRHVDLFVWRRIQKIAHEAPATES